MENETLQSTENSINGTLLNDDHHYCCQSKPCVLCLEDRRAARGTGGGYTGPFNFYIAQQTEILLTPILSLPH